MNKFLIFTNPDKDKGCKLSKRITEYIAEKGGSVIALCDALDEMTVLSVKGEFENYLGTEDKINEFLQMNDSADFSVHDMIMKKFDAAIILGGDGTMLRAAHYVDNYEIPLLGINLGTLGFLTEVEIVNIEDAIERLFADEYRLEDRMMIEGTVNGKCYQSLNDIVITRAGFSRIIGLNIYVNEQLLDTYEADGVIVATPTGSTGYNLSAGGPIVSPYTKGILVTPISPHSFTTKSVFFDSHDEIKVEIVKKRKTQNTEAIVSFDGGNNMDLAAGDIVTVKRAEVKAKFIKVYDVNFYSVLRDKMGGRL